MYFCSKGSSYFNILFGIIVFRIKMRRIFYFLIVILALACRKEPAPVAGNMDTVIAEAFDSLYSNTAYSRRLLQEAMREASDSLGFYRALQTYSLTYFVTDQPDSSRLTAERVISYVNRQKPSEEARLLLAFSYNNIGNCYGLLRKQDSALYYYMKGLDTYEMTSKREKAPDFCINIADMYTKRGDFARSAFYFRRALSISDSLDMTGQLGFPIYVGLAQLYMELQDFDLSDHYFRLAENQYEGRTLNEKFFFCNSRGNYYFSTEEYKEALPWFRKAKALLIPGGYQFSINLVNANMGGVFFHLDQPDSAHHYLDEAQGYFSGIDDQPLLYYIKTLKAGLALKDDNPQLARDYLKDDSDISKIEPTFIRTRNKYIQDYYARTGNFQDAYAYLLKNVSMDDSIRSERTRMRIAEMDMRYAQDTTLIKKEMLIMGQASDIRSLRMRNYVWLLVSLLIAAVAAIAYIVMNKQKKLQWMNFHDQVTRLRLSNIRNRISPHFLFNILNREISSGSESLHSNLKGLVLLLRRSLEMTDQTHITLTQELEFVEAYIKLEQESLGPDFRLEWKIDPHVVPTEVMLPPMIIQIPVENAIKHALRPLTGEKKLSICVKRERNGTVIDITDNGPGYQTGQESSSAGTGTGLKVLYQTIDLFNSKNREKIYFRILRSEEGSSGTKVSVYIPDNFKFR